jgi:hypothetical protein
VLGLVRSLGLFPFSCVEDIVGTYVLGLSCWEQAWESDGGGNLPPDFLSAVDSGPQLSLEMIELILETSPKTHRGIAIHEHQNLTGFPLPLRSNTSIP